MTETYDVVLDTLLTKHDALIAMTMQNMNSEFMSMGIMDDIRLEQCAQLKKAMRMWQAIEYGVGKCQTQY
jgi:hypothetical protein